MFKRNFYTCLLVIAGVLIAGFLYGRLAPASDYNSLVFRGSYGDVSVVDFNEHPQSTITGISILNPRITESAIPFGGMVYVSSNNNSAVFDGSDSYVSLKKSMSCCFIKFSRFGTIGADSKLPNYTAVSVSDFFSAQMAVLKIRKPESLCVTVVKCIFSNGVSESKVQWVLNVDPKCNEDKKG